MNHFLVMLAGLLFAAPAFAQDPSIPLSIDIVPAAPAMTIGFNPANPSLDCTVPAGTLVSTIVPVGGNGNPITYTLTAGDTLDFAISGSTVVVGPNGVVCPTSVPEVRTVTVTAHQS